MVTGARADVKAHDMGAPAARFGIISDVHSNLHALEAVLDALDAVGVDAIYCLGDVVGYNAFPEECARLVRERCDAVVMGNHDWATTVGTPAGFNPMGTAGVRHARERLSDDTRAWLSQLPLTILGDGDDVRLRLFHASPHDPLHTYVFPPGASAVLEAVARNARAPGPAGGDPGATSARSDPAAPHIVALGHTHMPMALVDEGAGAIRDHTDSLRDRAYTVRLRGGGQPGNGAEARERPAAAAAGGAAPVALINPGSVGQPRDGDPRASFATVDAPAGEVRLHRVAYDAEAAAEAVRRAGLPRGIGDRLLIGR